MTTKSIGFDIFARDRASSTFDKAGKSAETMGSKLKHTAKLAAVGFVAVGAGAVAAGTYVFNYGAKLEQMEAKAKTVFGGQIGLVNNWSKKSAHAMGLTTREATGLAANFADLLIPMGFARNEAAKMSTKVVGLSGALSQWSGGTRSAAEVSEILAKAMLGERDGLKELGISISEADVQGRLLQNGQSKLTGAALEQAKAQATQALIFEKSTDAQAAFAKGGSPLLSAQAKLKATFGEVRDSLVSKLVPALSDMATWFVDKGLPAVQKLGAQLSDKFGPTITKVANWFKNDLGPALQKLGAQLSDKFGPTITKVANWFKNDLGPALQKVGERMLPALKSAFESVKKALANAQPLFDLLGKVFVNILLPVLSKVASIVLPLLGKALEVVGKALGIAAGIVKKLASAFLFLGEYGIKAFRLLLTAAFATFEGILTAADKGLGWIPGIGSKIGDAKEAFSKFSDKTVEKLKRVEQKLHDTRDAVNGIPKNPTINLTVKVKGPLSALGIGTPQPSGGAGQGLGVLAPDGRVAGTLPRLAGRLLKPAGVTIMDGLIAGIDAGRAPLRSVLDKVTAFIGRQNEKIRDLIGKRSDLAAQFKGFTSSVFGADLGGDTGAAPTAGGLVAFQRAELAKAQRLKADVSKLVKMGLSKDLIQQLAASGEFGIAQIHALASGSASDVTQLNSLNAQTNAALGAAGMTAGNAVFGSRLDQARAAQAQAIAIREELQKWRKQEDKNTVVEIHLSGRIIRMSLLELKRQNGGAPLGIA